MKKVLCLVLALVVCVIFCACAKENEIVTGEVQKDVDKVTDIENNDNKENNQNTDVNDNQNQEQNNNEVSDDVVTYESSPLDYITAFGAHVLENDPESKQIASDFVKALIEGDGQTLANLTCGKPEQYDVISANITDYSIIPFGYTDEQSEQFANEGKHIIDDKYIVRLTVESYAENESTSRLFGDKKTPCFLMTANVYGDALTGAYVTEFIPLGNAEDIGSDLCLYTVVESNMDYLIKEFVAIYSRNIQEGKNYASEFDFSDSSHFITHVMANMGNHPPFSKNQINDFISKTFSENVGLSQKTLVSNWANLEYAVENMQYDYDRLHNDADYEAFGCSYAHGGSNAMYTVESVENTSDGTVVVVNTYADHAKLVVSSRYEMYFENDNEEEPVLVSVNRKNVTDFETLYASI